MDRGGHKRRLGDWHIRGALGSGGMGVVYDAVRKDGQRAALKVVNPALGQDPAFRARFRREIEVCRKVSGPRTAELLDADPDGNPPWLATEYVHGPTLEEAVSRNGPIQGEPLRSLAIALLQALDEVHRVGVVHRDLKPSNVILTPATPKVIDFGIALADEATSLTATGAFIGSAGWMSPEQARGEQVTTASDVFSWGAVMAYAATGRPPFGTGGPAAVAYRVVHTAPDLDGVPIPLFTAVQVAMTAAPADRPSPRDLVSHLTSGADATTEVESGWSSVPATIVAPPDRTSVGTSPLSDASVARLPRTRPSWLWASAVALVVLVAIVAGAVGLSQQGNTASTTLSETAMLATSSTTTDPTSTSSTSTPTSTSSTTSTASPTTSPLQSEPLFEGRFGASTSDALTLLEFANDHVQQTVRFDTALDGFKPEDLYRLNENTHVLYVPGTCEQFCEGDAYELLFRDLDTVPDASVYYDSGAIEINGRFVVNDVQIQNGGIFSVTLRGVPVA